jgi:type II secretory ATPase GspE/PulE/Tfp pilus assembly ATPase PilB-like protein
VVMRILGTGAVNVEMEKLGLSPRDFEVLKRELEKPNGMTLTTGPTGSGKTTTLYAFLRYLNRGGEKIITLEDPVEYKIESITQTPIDHAAGMTFASGLRAILRQDPDIVMVGEIRDQETAETAAQAALTGHVVLSTLHTNDAAGAIPRLLDLGVKAVTLAPALNALIAQRLLRQICQKCKEVYKPNQTELERVRRSLDGLPKDRAPKHQVFYHAPGCKACHHLGYKGRIGVFEVFAVDDAIEKLIYEGASSQAIKKAALSAGMTTMQQDGILKALAGLTDLAEVWRVTEE